MTDFKKILIYDVFSLGIKLSVLKSLETCTSELILVDPSDDMSCWSGLVPKQSHFIPSLEPF